MPQLRRNRSLSRRLIVGSLISFRVPTNSVRATPCRSRKERFRLSPKSSTGSLPCSRRSVGLGVISIAPVRVTFEPAHNGFIGFVEDRTEEASGQNGRRV